MTLLPPLTNSKYCYVGDINNHGEVVGVADMSVGPQHAWFYSPAMGTVDLNNWPSKPAAWRIGSAADINDLGEIVGDAWFQDDDGQTRSHAFLYTPGVGFIALGSLPDYPWSYAQAINIRGEVVGIAENDGASQERAFLGTAKPA